MDRDGVINELVDVGQGPTSPKRVDDFRFLPGVPEAVARLAKSYAVVVVTNQPDIARGHMSSEQLDRMTELVRANLEVAAVYVCRHDDADRCGCRKPSPGLLLKAARELDLDLARSFFVGDSWRDMEAARRAGVRACYVGREEQDERVGVCDLAAADLAEAADHILASR